MQKKSGDSESDLRQRAKDVLKSSGRKIDESTIRIVVDRLWATKEEGLRRKKGRIRRNFRESDVEREERDQQRSLKKAGLLDEISGADAAFEDLVDFELCQDLAGKFASESAGKTGDAIGDVRDRYETITTELRCVRATQLRTALAEECERDSKGLLRFLHAVFKRWRKIDQPDSLFRHQLLTHQLAGTPKEITNALEKVGAVATSATEQQFRSLHSRIRKYRSRDQKAALKRRGV
jgi:hypothetical protein